MVRMSDVTLELHQLSLNDEDELKKVLHDTRQLSEDIGTESCQSSEGQSPPNPPKLINQKPKKVMLLTQPSPDDIQEWTSRASSRHLEISQSANVLVATSMLPPARDKATSVCDRWVREHTPGEVFYSGWLIKRGHRIHNFKRRIFVIIGDELVYHDTHDATNLRGKIDLSLPTSIEYIPEYGFRIIQKERRYELIVYAMDAHDRDVWVKKLKKHSPHIQVLTSGGTSRKAVNHMTVITSREDGQIIFSGWLRKRGHIIKSTKRRWFILTKQALSYYADPQHMHYVFRKGIVPLSHETEISFVDAVKSRERYTFLIENSRRNLTLYADSQEEQLLWVSALCSVIGKEAKNDQGQPEIRRSLDDLNGYSYGDDTYDCRRSMASFLMQQENDDLVHMSYEVKKLLASPYSPEGRTSANFLKKHGTSRSINPSTVAHFMFGLAKYMIHTRRHELYRLASRKDQTELLERLLKKQPSIEIIKEESESVIEEDIEFDDELETRMTSVIWEQVEERILFPMYQIILSDANSRTRNEGKVMTSKFNVLRSKSQSFFGIAPKDESPSNWQEACIAFKAIDTLTLPYMKRKQLLEACHTMYTLYIKEHQGASPMNADQFIPAFIFVIIQAKLENPVLLRYLLTVYEHHKNDIFQESQLPRIFSGESAYFVTCFEIALEYIESLVTCSAVVLNGQLPLGIEWGISEEQKFLFVQNVEEDSQAAATGEVNIGDVLIAINGVKLNGMTPVESLSFLNESMGDLELCLVPSSKVMEKGYVNYTFEDV